MREGLLERVTRGLYINRLAPEVVELDEVAQYLRPGSVVSLQRVLGEHGVLNNPSRIVTALVAYVPGMPPPSGGEVKTEAGVFWFHVVSQKALHAGRPEDRLDPGRRYPCATPEKALIDWLYLARSPCSNMPAPPRNMDLDLLREGRLGRLAADLGLEADLASWREEVRALAEEADAHDLWGMAPGAGSP